MENDGFDGEDDSGELLACDEMACASAAAAEFNASWDGQGQYQMYCGSCGTTSPGGDLCPVCGSDDLEFEEVAV